MTTVSNPNSNYSYGAKGLCQIVGLTCLAGFVIDVLVLALPPSPLSVEWRVNFLQQVGDRSIIFLIGAALSMYGQLGNRQWVQSLAITCLVVGISFHLSCLLMFRDATVMQDIAVNNISNQAAQIQSRIQAAQNNVSSAAEVTPEQIQQASQLVANQAQSLKQNTETGILKAGLASIGNLIVIGLGLICIGRFGLQLRQR